MMADSITLTIIITLIVSVLPLYLFMRYQGQSKLTLTKITLQTQMEKSYQEKEEKLRKDMKMEMDNRFQAIEIEHSKVVEKDRVLTEQIHRHELENIHNEKERERNDRLDSEKKLREYYEEQIKNLQLAHKERERWVREDSKDQQRQTIKGQIVENIIALLPDFPYTFSDAKPFGGKPIDYIIFKNLNTWNGKKSGMPIEIIFLEVKTGKNKDKPLKGVERAIQDAIENKRVSHDIYKHIENEQIISTTANESKVINDIIEVNKID